MKPDWFEVTRRRHDRNRIIAHLQTLTGETRSTVVMRALQERLTRLTLPVTPQERTQRFINVLEQSLWRFGRSGVRHEPIDTVKEGEILGYGPEGV